MNANADNPRRLAVEAAAADKAHAIGREYVQTYIALQRKLSQAQADSRAAARTGTPAEYRDAQVQRIKAQHALARYLDDLGVKENR